MNMLVSKIYEKFISLNAIPLFEPEGKAKTIDRFPFLCEKHNYLGIQYRSYSSIKKGLNFLCGKCNCEIDDNKKRNSYEKVLKLFEDKNTSLFSKEYINNYSILLFVCNKHPEIGVQETTLNRLQRQNEICSQCYKESISKENCHLWNGGTSIERDIIMQSHKYKKWTQDVFNRDNYTCQCCGSKNKKLNAHHLYKFSIYKQYRFCLFNGITLCEDCHDSRIKNSFHNLYGSKSFTTPEDLYEYVQRYQSGEFEKRIEGA